MMAIRDTNYIVGMEISGSESRINVSVQKSAACIKRYKPPSDSAG